MTKICQRCAQQKSGIHTCTPSDLIRSKDAEIERLTQFSAACIAKGGEQIADIEALRAKVGELERLAELRGKVVSRDALDIAMGRITDLEADLPSSRASEAMVVEQLGRALRHYGDHTGECLMSDLAGCICGYSANLAISAADELAAHDREVLEAAWGRVNNLRNLGLEGLGMPAGQLSTIKAAIMGEKGGE